MAVASLWGNLCEDGLRQDQLTLVQRGFHPRLVAVQGVAAGHALGKGERGLRERREGGGSHGGMAGGGEWRRALVEG